MPTLKALQKKYLKVKHRNKSGAYFTKKMVEERGQYPANFDFTDIVKNVRQMYANENIIKEWGMPTDLTIPK